MAATDRLLDETLAAWRANERINTMLIKQMGAKGLAATLSTRGGRTVGRQFAHLHNTRLYQLSKRAKPIAEGLTYFPSKEEPGKRELLSALAASSKRVEEWLTRAHAGEPKFRLMKPGLVTTAAYLIAHESHHRGNMLLTLKQSGVRLGIAVTYGIWGEWGKQ